MKNLFLTLSMVFSALLAQAQESIPADTLITDLDKDLVQDSVILDKENATLTCQLSTQKFKPVTSMELELGNTCGVRLTKGGFELFNSYMRAGNACQFRYSPAAKKMRLAAMSRYEFGTASNDNSGKSSLNLLTGSYQGHWNYYNWRKDQLVQLPVIRQKMSFPVVYLANYSDKIMANYQDRCAALFEKAKRRATGKSSTFAN